MGQAYSQVQSGASRAAGAMVGAIGGAVVGGNFGFRLGLPSANEVIYNAVTSQWVPSGTEEVDSKTMWAQKIRMKTADKATAICASLSKFLYNYDARLLEIGKQSHVFTTLEELQEGDAQKAVTSVNVGDVNLLVFEDGSSEERPWAKVDLNDNFPVFLWLDGHRLIQGRKVSIVPQVKEFLCRKLNLLKTCEIQRAVYGSGGVLSPSFASIVIKQESSAEIDLYIGWQGTMIKQRPMDIFTDLAASPVRAEQWEDVYPGLWVHSGINAKIQNDLIAHREEIENLIRVYGVTRIIFFGHSLGGGLALVAHVSALSIFEKMTDAKKTQMANVAIYSITFAAPMVFFEPGGEEKRIMPSTREGCNNTSITYDNLSWRMENKAKLEGRGFSPEEVKDKWKSLEVDTLCVSRLAALKQTLMENSVNHVFDKDIVPQLPGRPQFYKPAVRMAAGSAVKEFVPLWKGKLEELVEKFCDEALNMQAVDKTFKELEKFLHLSTIMWYRTNRMADSIECITLADCADMPLFEEENDDTWRYLVTCHSILPTNVTYDAE